MDGTPAPFNMLFCSLKSSVSSWWIVKFPILFCSCNIVHEQIFRQNRPQVPTRHSVAEFLLQVPVFTEKLEIIGSEMDGTGIT